MMKIGDCKMVKFSDVKVGTFFQVDGREWYKHASGWGHACLAGFNKRFAKGNLKLIEIHREDIESLPNLMTILRDEPRKRFIVFCDDLSFDADDTSYKSLKAVLEGGIEGRPDNVIMYATSNRRHLLSRDMMENERSTAINPGEAVEEKVSLSDRFGLWLGFHKCSQDEYLAMVRGYCIGGGAATAANCDIRIVADDSKYGVPAGKLGLGYRYGGIKRLADLVGPQFTAEIFFTARQFNAQEALTMGLVNRVVPVAELESTVREYADAIGRNAPLTLAAVKLALLEYGKDDNERDLALCEKMVNDCFASEDYKEGQTAFMEKRKPVFKGR